MILLGLLQNLFVVDARRKVLSVKNSDFALVNKNEEKTFVQKEALVDRESVTNVKAVELDLR